MFKTRFLSGAVLVVLIAIVLYFGGCVTGAATLLLSLGGAFELLRIYKLHNTAMGVVCYITTVVYYALIALQKTEFIMPLIVGYVLISLAIYVIAYPRYMDSDAAAAIMTFLYVVVMLSYMYQIRLLEHGGALVVLIFVCSWVNDTCAYLVGVKFGKHKMTPKLSPKKSIEGLIGGIGGAALVGMGYGIFINENVYHLNNAPLIFAITGAIGAMVAVIGDLAASAIKRNNEIKDYGKLIPGHGGIMDRFDSIIFTAPIIYYCLTFMLK